MNKSDKKFFCKQLADELVFIFHPNLIVFLMTYNKIIRSKIVHKIDEFKNI